MIYAEKILISLSPQKNFEQKYSIYKNDIFFKTFLLKVPENPMLSALHRPLTAECGKSLGTI